MASQFFGLNIAYKGLTAANASLNTTANNISNTQTKGYSRQEVVTKAAEPLRVFANYGCAGAGVDALYVERIRDEFYDNKYWNAQSNNGHYESLEYYSKIIETQFTDDKAHVGFSTIFDQFRIAGLQETMKTAHDESAKKQFIGFAGQLTDYFNNTYAELMSTQEDCNQEIKTQIDRINSIAAEIVSLNKQINTLEIGGNSPANELRDARTLLVDELGKLVSVSTKEIHVMDPNDPDQETNVTRYIVTIGGGELLVDGYETRELECVARATYEKINQTDAEGLYDVRWVNEESSFGLQSPVLGGTLQGLVEMRDGNNNENFNGIASKPSGTVTIIEDIPAYYDDFGNYIPPKKNVPVSHDTITLRPDPRDKFMFDLNKSNLPESGGIIRIDGKEFHYDSWSVAIDSNGDYEYTFVLSHETALNPERLGGVNVGATRVEIGDAIDYQGIPYYMNQMNEWVRTFSQKFNDTLRSGYTADGDIGMDLFTGEVAGSNEQWLFGEDMRYDTDYNHFQTTLDAQNAVRQRLGLANVSYITICGSAASRPYLTKAEDTQLAGQNTGLQYGYDSYYKLTAGNFQIKSFLEDDPKRLATKTERNKTDGESQYDLLEELQLVMTDKNKMSFRGCNASEFLQCVMADVALNTSNANTLSSNYTNISKSIDNQRISISGVDEDEEAINLVKFQNSYNLASRMIQTLTEVYDRLITQTGV